MKKCVTFGAPRRLRVRMRLRVQPTAILREGAALIFRSPKRVHRSVDAEPIELQSITFYLKQAPSVAQSGLILWCAALALETVSGSGPVHPRKDPSSFLELGISLRPRRPVPPPWFPLARCPLPRHPRVLPTCLQSNFYLPNRTWEKYWRTNGYSFKLTQARGLARRCSLMIHLHILQRHSRAPASALTRPQFNAGFATFDLTENPINRTVIQPQQSYCARHHLRRATPAQRRPRPASSLPHPRPAPPLPPDFYVFMDGGFQNLQTSRIQRWRAPER